MRRLLRLRHLPSSPGNKGRGPLLRVTAERDWSMHPLVEAAGARRKSSGPDCIGWRAQGDRGEMGRPGAGAFDAKGGLSPPAFGARACAIGANPRVFRPETAPRPPGHIQDARHVYARPRKTCAALGMALATTYCAGGRSGAQRSRPLELVRRERPAFPDPLANFLELSRAGSGDMPAMPGFIIAANDRRPCRILLQ
jgi:hypothetical protein